MDIFNEYIIKRKRTGSDYLKISGILCGSIVLFYVLLNVLALLGQYGTMFIVPVIAGLIFLDWYLVRMFSVEYEYSVTNGYVVVDQIIARSRRKRIVTFESRDIEAMQKYRPEAFAQRSFEKKLDAGDHNPESEQWCAEFTHKDLGRTLLIFTPSERILAAMKPFMRRQVAFNAFGRN